MSYKVTSLDKLGKELLKVIKKDVDAVNRAAARAANLSARKARTEIARQAKKLTEIKDQKKYKKSIKIQKATKDNPIATMEIPDKGSEIRHNGKNYLMIPSKKGITDYGLNYDNLTKQTGATLLKYSEKFPKKTTAHTNSPKPFLNIKVARTGQMAIAVRKKDERKKMNWLYLGKEGKNPDYIQIINDTTDKNLEKDFERELAKIVKKDNL